jgi:hypothetical protein
VVSIEKIVLIGVLAAGAALAVALRRGGARGVMFAGAMAAGVYGIVLTVSMTAHIVDILSRWYIGRGYDGTSFGYDFRLYSLVLLGVLLTALGVRLVRAALRMSRGEPAGRSGALVAAGLATIVVVPLIPIQRFFAVPFSVLGAIVLLILALVKVEPDTTPHI